MRSSGGSPIDVTLPRRTPFDVSRFGRGRRVHPSERFWATFASPEDLIVKKLEHYRQGGSEKHLRDVAGILKIGGEQIDRQYVSRRADRLGLRDRWDAALARLKQP